VSEGTENTVRLVTRLAAVVAPAAGALLLYDELRGTAPRVFMLIIGGAQVVSWLLAYQNIPQQLADLILATTQSPVVFLLLVNVLLLLVGTFLENGPALVILAPVLYPIAATLGIDPIHFSVIVALNLVLGLITPPVAISLSIGALIARVPTRVVTREVTPFFITAIGVLMLITYVPQLSLWLPNFLHGK